MKNLTEEKNLYKTFILFAIPIVLSGLLTQGYDIINTIIAGKFLGNDGLAAIGATSAFITFLSCIFWGYGAGVSMYSAKKFGAGKFYELKNIAYNNFILIAFFCIVIAILVAIFKNPILTLLRVDPEIRYDAGIYMTVYVAGLFAFMLNYAFVTTLQAMGASAFPFVMSVISAILNIAGNIFTVTVLNWGVFGIAFSSVLAAVLVDIFFLIKLKLCFSELGVGNQKIKFDLSVFKKSYPYAAPVSLQQMIMYAAALLISPMINSISSAASASYNVVMRIQKINANIYENSSKTVSNYVAQSVGAKKFGNLEKGIKVGFIQAIAFMSPVLIACVLFAKPICSSFFAKGEEAVALEYTIVFTKYFLPFLFINVINNLFHAFFRGITAMKLLIISTFIGSASRVLLSLVLVGAFSMNGIFAGWVLSWAVEAIFCLYVYFSGIWKCDLKK